MKVVIIEDETLTAQRLVYLLQAYDSSIDVLAQLSSVARAIQWFSGQLPGQLPDIVFMDIQLDDGTAFNLLEQFRLDIPIIFTTAYDTYALQAFKVNSVDYLLKPINADELAAALQKFKRLWRPRGTAPAESPSWQELVSRLENAPQTAYKDRFMVTIGPRIKSIPVSQIAYFFYADKTTYLMTQEGQTLVIEHSLDKLATLVDPHEFFRVNRAFLVALPAIQSIHTYSVSKLKLELLPAARQEILVSSDRLSAFKSWLGK